MVTAHTFRQPSWYELVSAIEPSVQQAPTQLFLGQDMKSLPSPVLDRLSAQYFVADPVRPVPGTTINPPAATSSMTFRGTTSVSGILPASSAPLRAVIVDLARPLPSSGASEQRLTVDVLAGNRQVATGFRDLNDGWSAGGLAIAVPENSAVPTSVRLVYAGTKNPLTLASDGRAAVVGRIDDPGDGARVVQSGSAVVYDRTHALPRIRWMPKSTVIASKPARLKALVDGTVPLDTVVLASGKGVTPGSGQQARSFKVVTDNPEHIRVDVDAGGAGFVEVADAIQDGWTATVDGHSATLLDADHALVAVAVPAGHHVIDVTYHATGQRKGFAVSFLSLLVLLGIGVGPFIRRRITVQRAAAVPSGSGTE